MNKQVLPALLITALTLAAVSCWAVPAQAQTPVDETTLTGAARSTAAKQVLAWYVTKDKIRAHRGRRASFEGTTTSDFIFVFAPADRTEALTRDEFFQKSGGGKHDPKAKDFLHDGPKVQPDRFVSRNGGKEIVLYEYPLLVTKRPAPADGTGKASAPQKQVMMYTLMEEFVQSPKGLLMRSMRLSHMRVTTDGEAIPESMLSGLTFAQFSGTEKTKAKAASPPVIPDTSPKTTPTTPPMPTPAPS